MQSAELLFEFVEFVWMKEQEGRKLKEFLAQKFSPAQMFLSFYNFQYFIFVYMFNQSLNQNTRLQYSYLYWFVLKCFTKVFPSYKWKLQNEKKIISPTKRYFSEFIKYHSSKCLGVSDLRSHILFTHLTRDVKFMYTR